VHAAVGDEAQAATELARAAELAPDDATVWYELFSFYHDAKDNALHDKAPPALGHAYLAAPDNLALQLTWLDTQIESKDPNVKQTVAAMRSEWARMPGLLANVSARSNGLIADPIEWLGRIASAAEQGDWRTAMSLSRRLANVVRPESWTLSDLRRLQRHPLEYVLHDFQTVCPRSTAAEPPGTKVKLSELPSTEQPPALAGIRDLVLADYDLDERLDLIVLRETNIEVYSRNHGSGWRKLADATIAGDFQRIIAADLDRDDPQQPGTDAHRRDQERKQAAEKQEGADASAVSPNQKLPCHRADLDLIVYGPSGIRFLRNNLEDDASRSLVEASQAPELGEITGVQAAVAADFYHDGDLDIALVAADGIHLWSNRGDLSFTDVTAGSQLPKDADGMTAIVAVDWDHDIDLDLLAAGESGKPAGYLENLRHGQFRWHPYGAGFDALNQAKSLAVLDADARGSWRLAATGAKGASLLRTDISQAGLVSSKASRQITSAASDGVLHWDFNNDGNLDLAVWSGKGIEFFEGADSGEMVSVPSLLAAPPQNIRACRTGDLDGDGDEDLAVAEKGQVVLYSNEGGNALRWLDIELQAGVVDQGQSLSFRCDHYGLGSVVEVRSGSRVQHRM
ncbi:MAG: FG-GAP repeat domain-containing protein, partial [Pirellulales bacterium]